MKKVETEFKEGNKYKFSDICRLTFKEFHGEKEDIFQIDKECDGSEFERKYRKERKDEYIKEQRNKFKEILRAFDVDIEFENLYKKGKTVEYVFDETESNFIAWLLLNYTEEEMRQLRKKEWNIKDIGLYEIIINGVCNIVKKRDEKLENRFRERMLTNSRMPIFDNERRGLKIIKCIENQYETEIKKIIDNVNLYSNNEFFCYASSRLINLISMCMAANLEALKNIFKYYDNAVREGKFSNDLAHIAFAMNNDEIEKFKELKKEQDILKNERALMQTRDREKRQESSIKQDANEKEIRDLIENFGNLEERRLESVDILELIEAELHEIIKRSISEIKEYINDDNSILTEWVLDCELEK